MVAPLVPSSVDADTHGNTMMVPLIRLPKRFRKMEDFSNPEGFKGGFIYVKLSKRMVKMLLNGDGAEVKHLLSTGLFQHSFPEIEAEVYRKFNPHRFSPFKFVHLFVVKTLIRYAKFVKDEEIVYEAFGGYLFHRKHSEESMRYIVENVKPGFIGVMVQYTVNPWLVEEAFKKLGVYKTDNANSDAVAGDNSYQIYPPVPFETSGETEAWVNNVVMSAINNFFTPLWVLKRIWEASNDPNTVLDAPYVQQALVFNWKTPAEIVEQIKLESGDKPYSFLRKVSYSSLTSRRKALVFRANYFEGHNIDNILYEDQPIVDALYDLFFEDAEENGVVFEEGVPMSWNVEQMVTPATEGYKYLLELDVF